MNRRVESGVSKRSGKRSGSAWRRRARVVAVIALLWEPMAKRSVCWTGWEGELALRRPVTATWGVVVVVVVSAAAAVKSASLLVAGADGLDLPDVDTDVRTTARAGMEYCFLRDSNDCVLVGAVFDGPLRALTLWKSHDDIFACVFC